MAGYRRFIAYVYEYRNGKKENNCGFIKVEVRDQACIMEIHLQLNDLPEETECKVYGFWRKDGLLNGIFLGKCETERNRIDGLVETNALDVGGTGMALGKMGGMILTVESGRFFGTEWDDQAIRPENFKEIKVEKNIEVKNAEGRSGEGRIAEAGDFKIGNTKGGDGERGDTEEQNVEKENAKRGNAERGNAERGNAERENAKRGNAEREDAEREDAERGNTERENAEGENKEGRSVKRENAERRNAEEGNEQETENNNQKSEKRSNLEIEENKKLKEQKAIKAETEIKKESGTKEEKQSREPAETKEKSVEIEEFRMTEKQAERKEIQELKKIQLPFGREFYPFEDNDVLQCWKIHPQDLVHFPRRQCALRNNRFLQYGYYNFGHLLLCRRQNGRYIIGVPGCYDQQEQFMAGMFGFSCFKPSPQIKVPKGKGGYWYRAIDSPN